MPDCESALNGRGNAYREIEQYEDAFYDFEKLLKINSKN